MWRSGWRLSGRVLAAVGGSSLLCMSAGPNLGLGSPPPARASSRALPTFSFGVIADVQWADLPDGTNFAGTTRRCYRGALAQLSGAVDWWRALERPPGFIAQLGDLIDGQNAKLGTSNAALEAAQAHLERAPCRVVNLVGNHELYNFGRKELARRLSTAPPPAHREFYGFSPAAGWRVLVLDSYQEAIIGYEDDDPRREAAVRTLAAHNPNDVVSGTDWFRGISGRERRFVPYNGGLGREQLEWLRAELAEADAARERVLVLSHVILHPKACDGSTMLWDYPEALELIHASRSVVAVLCGHDHKGRYHLDSRGVHHLTFCSPLNRGADGAAYGLVRVWPDSLELVGPRLGDLLPKGGGVAAPRLETHDDGTQCESITLPLDRGKVDATRMSIDESWS